MSVASISTKFTVANNRSKEISNVSITSRVIIIAITYANYGATRCGIIPIPGTTKSGCRSTVVQVVFIVCSN